MTSTVAAMRALHTALSLIVIAMVIIGVLAILGVFDIQFVNDSTGLGDR